MSHYLVNILFLVRCGEQILNYDVSLWLVERKNEITLVKLIENDGLLLLGIVGRSRRVGAWARIN